ncbi:2-haloacrylate reductase [Vibrio stylophorae]|uniref:2-haloacrylate reductase n=1 Tax=Vibrio stylophorae TaxID=659351 RepID=A0ABM8ZVK1_9VIBR|nr:NADP-dependent oxidoreductase [Vibrio stylophorae]CAH0534335.1 2-haloacrylate reductase [Vibrio stylophorae]
MPQNIALQLTQFGPPESLTLAHAELPPLAAHQVLVKVEYAGINPVDAKTRAGLGWAAQRYGDQLPWTPGFDIAGEIVELGTKVQGLSVGQRVAGLVMTGGGYSQYVAVDAALLCAVPNHVSSQKAAGLPLAGLTAWQALAKANIRPGERVLILAGAGGVGHLAIQLANSMQAQVIASCSSDNVDFVKELGAIALDYRQAPLAEQCESVDVIIDLIGGEVGLAALQCGHSNCRVVTLPTVTAQQVIEAAERLAMQAQGLLVEAEPKALHEMLNRVEAGHLKVEISHIYPLYRGADAHRAIESGHTRGKMLFDLDNVTP